MGKKSIKKNYIYNLSYQILLLLTPLITTPYISRVLHAEGIGTVSFAESIVSYFVLFAGLGTATLGQREISYVQDDKEKRSKVFWNILIIRIVATLVCLGLYSAFIIIYRKNVLMYALFMINILAVMFDVTFILQGMEEFGKIVARNFVFKILTIVFIFLFVKDENDVIVYVIGLVALNIISNLSLWVYIPKLVTKFYRHYLGLTLFLKDAFLLFIPTIAIQIYTMLDKTMIGIFADGASQNGYYEQAMRISKMVLTLVTSLGTVMIPRIGYHLGRKDNEGVKNYMYKSYRFVWFLGIPLCFGLIAISDNLVPWFFGPGFDEVKTLLKILSVLILAIGFSNVTGMQYMIPARKQNKFTITILIGAGCNFMLNLLLIPHFFAIGAAIASVVAETIITASQFILIKKEISFFEVIKLSKKYFISGIVMIIVLVAANILIKESSIMNTLILITIGCIVYILLLIIMKDDFMKGNINTLINRFIGRVNEKKK